jgi:mRNA interferase MazF
MCDKCQVGYGYDYMIFKKNHHHAKGGVDNV